MSRGKYRAKAARQADEATKTYIAELETQQDELRARCRIAESVLCRVQEHHDLELQAAIAVGQANEAKEYVERLDQALNRIEDAFFRLAQTTAQYDALVPETQSLLAELDIAWEGAPRWLRRMTKRNRNARVNLMKELSSKGLKV